MTTLRRFLGDVLTILAVCVLSEWQTRRRQRRRRRALAAMRRVGR